MSNKPRRILFVRLSAVGDVINTLPALDTLRKSFPDAHIGYAVEDRAYSVIEGHPQTDIVHLYPRKRWVSMLRHPSKWRALIKEIFNFFKDIRSQRYEVALNYQSNLKGALFALLSRAPLRAGFAKQNSKESSHIFNHINVSPEGGELINRVEKFIALSVGIGAQGKNAEYRLPDCPEYVQTVAKWRKDQNLNKYAVIHPGTSEYGAQKRWLPERFSELASRIHKDLGLRPVITWGPGEIELAEGIVNDSHGVALLSMQTSHLLELAEIIRGADLYVGCDSGPLHLASAAGTPSVALFGPKDPRTYAPYNPHSRVVQKGEYNGEMMDIEVEDVFSAASDLIQEISRTTAV